MINTFILITLFASVLLASPLTLRDDSPVRFARYGTTKAYRQKSRDNLNSTIYESPIISNLFRDYGLPHDELGATVFALLYGLAYPSFMNEFKGAQGLQALGTNNIYNLGKPATPSTSPVIRPNVDTIYALSVVDLAEQDLILSVPEMEPDRYYVFAFYDPYFQTLSLIYRDVY